MSLRSLGVKAAWILLCGFLPLIALYYAIGPVMFGDVQAADFRLQLLLRGRGDPRRGGLLSDRWLRHPRSGRVDHRLRLPSARRAPDRAVDARTGRAAEILFQLLLVGVFVSTLALLGVRDWRCYGLAFLWPPVTDAIATGNITILLGLAAAVVWRYRDLPAISGAALGASIAAKVFLWPLVIWLAVTRRVAAALWSVARRSGSTAPLVGDRVVPRLRRVPGPRAPAQRSRWMSAVIRSMPSGSISASTRAWHGDYGLATAIGVLAASVLVARRGDEQGAFVLALAAAIACSPIVWLHYFALLLVAVAIARPRSRRSGSSGSCCSLS